MSFIKQIKNTAGDHKAINKKPFYKRRGWKAFFVILGTSIIVLASFLAYIFATGSKVFENQINPGSLARAIKGQQLNGEADGRINILLMGRGGDNHPGGLLTDSMLVASINTKDKKIALISIPRDLLVPIKNHGEDKLNSAFSFGYQDYMSKTCKKKKQSDCSNDALASGSALTQQTVSSILGIPIQYYVMMDFDGFKQLVDKIGGVDVYVDKAIYDPLYPDKTMTGYEPFSIKVGQQHMNGDLALKYSRSRETSSDFDRSRRQQQVISAIKDKALKSGMLANPKTILDLVTIIGNHLRTNFQPTELKPLADIIKSFDQNSITSKVISSASDSYLISDSSSGTFYLKTKTGNFNQIQEMVKNIFSDSNTSDPILKIELLNGSKTAGLATKVSAQLPTDKFEVVSVQNSQTKYKTSTIYDYTNGLNQSTVDYLKNKYNTEVVKKSRPSGSDVDITLIIGDDFHASS